MCLLQAIKCRLADLPVPEGDWSQEAILWVKEAVMGSEACRMKVLSTSKIDLVNAADNKIFTLKHSNL